MIITPINIWLGLTVIINLILGFFIYFRSLAKKKANLFYALAVLSASFWSFCMLMFRISEGSFLKFWSLLLWAATVPILFCFFCFSLNFPKEEKPRRGLFLYFLAAIPPLVVLFISILHLGLFEKIVIIKGNRGFIFNLPNFYFYCVYILGYFAIGFIILFKKYFRNRGIIRVQILFVIVGTLISALGGVIFGLFLPLIGSFKLYWMSPGSLIAVFVFIAYASTRYRLMDIRLIIRRSLLYFLLILYVAGLYAFLSSVASRILIETTGASSAFVPLVIAFIIVIGLEPIKKILARYTDRLFYKDRIDYQGVLRSLSEVVAREIDLTELVDSILQVLVKQLKVKSGLVLVADKQGRFFKLESYLNSRKNVVLGSKNHLIKHLKEKPDIIITEELVRMIEDVKTKREKNRLERVRKELDLLDCGLCIPVIIEEELTAVMIIGPKLSGDMFSVEDIRLFEVLSPQMAAALEKAKLYQEVQDFTKTLQQKVAQATRELQRANARLKQLDEAKSEFLSIATHQLRTPLTAIKGYLAMLTEGDYGRLQPEQQKAALTVFTSADRLNRLVNVFLNVSRIEAGRLKIEKKEVLLEELARKVVENFRQEAESKGLSLEFIKPKWPSKKIRADSDKLTDVANNLVDNAIKYTSYGKIEVRVYEKDNQIFFSVKDTGMGIRKPDLAELFNKFKRTDRSEGINTRGAGLGLFIAKKLVEAHGGKIWAESKGEGQGSMFVFSLPLV